MASGKSSDQDLSAIKTVMLSMLIACLCTSWMHTPATAQDKDEFTKLIKDCAPKTLEEAFAQFDQDLIPANRQRFKATAVNDLANFANGSHLKDPMMVEVYGKWQLAPLQRHLAKSGLTEPNDLDDILLLSYWRHLNKIPLDVDTQIADSQARRGAKTGIVEPNKPMPDTIWQTEMVDATGTNHTLKSISAAQNVIALIDTDLSKNIDQLNLLKQLRKRHGLKKVAIIVCVIPPSNIANAYWPSIKAKDDNDSAAQATVDHMSNCKDIPVFVLSPQLAKAFFLLLKSKGHQAGPPQTLFVSESGLLKTRVSGFDNEETPQIFKRLIKQAK